jgi:hypothetical protein
MSVYVGVRPPAAAAAAKKCRKGRGGTYGVRALEKKIRARRRMAVVLVG